MLDLCGLSEKLVRELVEELGKSNAPLVVAGAPVVHTNSLDGVIASHYINLMLGNVGKKGGMLPPAETAAATPENRRVADILARAQVVLLDHTNPAYTLPRATGILDRLGRAETVVCFSALWTTRRRGPTSCYPTIMQ
jgi:anaerobic selenocysteine-containing dehydrogenase